MTLEESLEKKLIEINQALDVHAKAYSNVGLLMGLPGAILFKLYYAQYLNKEQHIDEAYELIQECFEKFDTHQLLLTYCDGVAGFGWTLDHLVQRDLLDSDNDTLLSDLDTTLYNQMVRNFENQEFDFLHGATGYAFYFLNRYRITSATDLKDKYKAYLHFYIDEIIEISVKDEQGYRTWLSVIDLNGPQKVYNLSMSHGVTSILGFFTKLAAYDEFREKSVPIIKEIVAYLLNTENENFMCSFPSYIHSDGTKSMRSRVAWCYGDLGIGLQLWHASLLLKDDVLQQKALNILKDTTKRKSGEESGVVDASICHGSYGNAHIYSRLFQQTKDPIFKEAADFWLQDGLDRAFHEDGFAGYKQKQPNHWETEIGLLEGISGIGLVIIDYLSEEPNTWDEAFMIS
jgi:lantibiotic modifying enzyme